MRDTVSSSTNVGAIVGGVVGGVVGALAIALFLLFVVRRRRFHSSGGTKERPVDLLRDDEGDNAPGDGRLPEYYQPEPFVLPDPTVASSQHNLDPYAPAGSSRPSGDHRQSYLSTSTSADGAAGVGVGRAGGSSIPSTSARKSPAPPSFRPVNIIQHDDAGLADQPPPPEEEPETIELPPAYTNIRRDVAEGSSAPAAGGSTAAAQA